MPHKGKFYFVLISVTKRPYQWMNPNVPNEMLPFSVAYQRTLNNTIFVTMWRNALRLNACNIWLGCKHLYILYIYKQGMNSLRCSCLWKIMQLSVVFQFGNVEINFRFPPSPLRRRHNQNSMVRRRLGDTIKSAHAKIGNTFTDISVSTKKLINNTSVFFDCLQIVCEDDERKTSPKWTTSQFRSWKIW